MPDQKVGRVIQVIGPVLDIQFEEGHLPAIYNAVRVTSEGFNVPEPLDITVEVQQHLGEGCRLRGLHQSSSWRPNARPRYERARQPGGPARPNRSHDLSSDSP